MKTPNTITENQIKEIGYKLAKSYKHDQYHTNRYEKGRLMFEFTYEKKKLLTCDLVIPPLECTPISFSELKQISELLSKWAD
ncbi:MAG: hypothetical protein KGZ97_12135 [Bacteroidetes bacterium]|nr:hypothetical protein [Bacteroidota bacterium]